MLLKANQQVLTDGTNQLAFMFATKQLLLSHPQLTFLIKSLAHGSVTHVHAVNLFSQTSSSDHPAHGYVTKILLSKTHIPTTGV